jgi:hypothetical protein
MMKMMRKVVVPVKEKKNGEQFFLSSSYELANVLFSLSSLGTTLTFLSPVPIFFI